MPTNERRLNTHDLAVYKQEILTEEYVLEICNGFLKVCERRDVDVDVCWKTLIHVAWGNNQKSLSINSTVAFPPR